MGATLKVFAVKICRDRKVMPREHEIWKSLSHENILQLCGTVDSQVPKLAGLRTCIFVSPFMKRGNLGDYLKYNPLADRLPLMIDVACGLEYLHKVKALVHGDIKAENILISDEGRALLADFGLSTTVSVGSQATGFHVRQLYTLAYCAPEIVDDDAEDPSAPGVKRSKTKMSDMYAYGVLLYQTYAGGLVKGQRARWKLMADMYDGHFPPRPVGRLPVFCDDLWSICTRCWAKAALDRPLIAIVLAELRDLASSQERQIFVTERPG
ncbi:kinase-like protein [Auricularia subglabra TFB-10046 SS5]|nr:kinase-like protein [Auricularia subglabra TFB-10046 SS5]